MSTAYRDDTATPATAQDAAPVMIATPILAKNRTLRKLLGLSLLLVTVFLWTASGFLASSIFADDTFSKPYLITYVNTAIFIVSLPPILLRRFYVTRLRNWLAGPSSTVPTPRHSHEIERFTDEFADGETGPVAPPLYIDGEEGSLGIDAPGYIVVQPLTLKETSRLAFRFCFLWFVANYLTAACLQYTTVASSVILTSTSSVFTLLFGALFKVEKFNVRKLLGVLASLAGVMMISSVDVSGKESNRGSFPYKSPGEIAVGDAMALVSAILYGVYAVGLSKVVGVESRINMPLFFGFVGLINIVFLWPGFFLLHFTGVETFQLPPTPRIFLIILFNALASLISDICWAYAMLLTSPLIVTVGLSLTIPLSLIGQMVLDSHYSTPLYWIGACAVVSSFVFISYESKPRPEIAKVVVPVAPEEQVAFV
ncbi:hypothetical protein MRB53_039721 [Persea americana]|nr:hypothetical protein MRB53_039721 [Persea americana]